MILLTNGSSAWENFFQLIGILLVFLFVLAVTYFTTKWIGGYQKNQISNKNIHIVETFRVTNNKFIQILELGEVYLVVAICKDNISMLAKLTKEELPEVLSFDATSNQTHLNESFHDILEKIKNNRKVK
ncbi:MAG: flagellar biosynthetic protein FliO [Lachnospiraceae bacterium]